MGLVYFFCVLVVAPLVLSQPTIPVPFYTDIFGLYSFCPLGSWYSTNSSLSNFQSLTIGADGTRYFVAVSNTICQYVLAFSAELDPLWQGDCLPVNNFTLDEKLSAATGSLTVDDQRHILYYFAQNDFAASALLALNATTGSQLWFHLFEYPTLDYLSDEGYQNLRMFPYFDFNITGDVYLFTSNYYMINYDMQNCSGQFSVINHTNGAITYLNKVTLMAQPFNWSSIDVYFPTGSKISWGNNLLTSSPIWAPSPNSTKGEYLLFFRMQVYITYEYERNGYYINGNGNYGTGLYGFDLKTGNIAYNFSLGLYVNDQLFLNGNNMYFSTALTDSQDSELVSFNYVTQKLLWRYPNNGALQAYNPSEGILYVMENAQVWHGIDAVASDSTGNIVTKFSYQLTQDLVYAFQIFAIDNAGNLYGTSNPVDQGKSTPAIYVVADNKVVVGDSLSVSFVALDNDGNMVTIDGTSIRSYQSCPPPSVTLDGELIATIVVGGLTLIFNFADYILTKIKGGIGPSKLTPRIKGWKIFLILFQVITTLVMTIVGAVSQHDAYVALGHLNTLLSDIPTFRDNYVVPYDCEYQSDFVITDLCFCQTYSYTKTTLDIAQPMCNINACPARYTTPGEIPDCAATIQDECLCSLWFDQWKCGCNYPLDIHDTMCSNTTIAVETNIYQPNLHKAFDACFSHYHTILNLLWATYAIHLFVTAVTMGLQVHSMNYLGSEDNKGPARFISMSMTFTSNVTTAILVIAAVVVGLQGQVCTRPEVDPKTIHDSRYIMNQFPGCTVNNQFHQLNLEGQLFDGVRSSLSVIGAKPALSLMDFLHQLVS